MFLELVLVIRGQSVTQTHGLRSIMGPGNPRYPSETKTIKRSNIHVQLVYNAT